MSGKYNIVNSGTGNFINNYESHNSGVQNIYGTGTLPESSSASSSNPALLSDGPRLSRPKTHCTIPLRVSENSNPNSHALALIINVYKYETSDRNGSHLDPIRLSKILNLFNVGIYEPDADLKNELISHTHIEEWITEFQSKFLSGSAKVSLVFIMGHGDEPNQLLDSYNTRKSLESSVFTRFNNQEFPAMMNKPKLFFINCCRGNVKTPPVPKMDGLERDAPKPKPTVPTVSDILIVWSTTPRNYSIRNPKEGSIFINKFCDQMDRYYNFLNKEKLTHGSIPNYEFRETILQPVANEMEEYVTKFSGMGLITQTTNFDLRTFGHFSWLLDDCVYLKKGNPPLF